MEVFGTELAVLAKTLSYANDPSFEILVVSSNQDNVSYFISKSPCEFERTNVLHLWTSLMGG